MSKQLSILRSVLYDDNEIVNAIRSEGPCSRALDKKHKHFELSTGQMNIGELFFSENGKLCKIQLDNTVFNKIIAKIKVENNSSIKKIIRTVLFSHKKLEKASRVSDYFQIRPIDSEQLDYSGFDGTGIPYSGLFYPFSLEVIYKASDFILLDSYRGQRELKSVMSLLSTFLVFPVFSLNTPYCWVRNENKNKLVLCGFHEELNSNDENVFTDITKYETLAFQNMDEYYRRFGIGINDFQIPDLSLLFKAVESLKTDEKEKYLRVAANIFEASNPTISHTQRYISLVSSVEPLLGKVNSKLFWKKVSINKSFKTFIQEYVQPSNQTKDYYEIMYHIRSQILHGNWHFFSDESLRTLYSKDPIFCVPAWTVSKIGSIFWLLKKNKLSIKSL